MSVSLRSSDERRLKVNAWNWGVLHELVSRAEVLPPEEWVPARYGGGCDFDATAVSLLAAFLEEQVLPHLRAGERMLLDGSTTDIPDDGTLHRGAELALNYSLDREVLVAVIRFLREAAGPVTIS